MGNKCCSPPLDTYEIKVQKVEQAAVVQMRKGLPSKKVAIKIQEIDTLIQSISKIEEIKQLNFKVASYDKKFREPIRIHKQPIPQNKLLQTYYLPQLHMFYLGEWVYNFKMNDNVPGGIGRLYEMTAISQGSFKTIILNKQQAQLVKQKEKQQQFYSYQKLSNKNQQEQQRIANPFQSKLISSKKRSVKKLLLPQQYNKQENQQFIYVVKLHGPGRIYSGSQDKQQQIQMEGQFYEGVLNGKGVLKISQFGQQKYSYNGLWKNGEKHGKGVQKTPKYKYEGAFFQNTKHGKGIQTFQQTMKEEHEVQKDIQKLERKIATEGDNLKMEAFKKVAIRQYRQKLLQSFLDTKPQLHASQIKLNSQRSFIIDMNFNMQRTYRSIFTECYNGDFKNDKMDGQGTYIWSNGKTYKGKWSNNRLHGQGEFYWPDGSYYYGKYENDERHGEGIMIWNAAKRYRGNWAYGLRHGYGQSIQIKQKQQEMTIKCSIWDRDKVKTSISSKKYNIEGWNNIQLIEKYVQEQFLDETEKQRIKKQKQKNKGKAKQTIDTPDFKLLSLKQMNDNQKSEIKYEIKINKAH